MFYVEGLAKADHNDVFFQKEHRRERETSRVEGHDICGPDGDWSMVTIFSTSGSPSLE